MFGMRKPMKTRSIFVSGTKTPEYFQNWNPPFLVGHRGHRLRRLKYRTTEVENTMAAFRRAWAAGCDGLELDVRLSRDGVLVVHHDAWLRTAKGRWAIARTPWRELRGRAAHLTTLPAVLRQFGARCWLDIEVKTAGGEAALAAALQRQPPQRGFVVSSFDVAVLRRLRALNAGLPLCWNLGGKRRPNGALRWPRLGLAGVAAHERRVTAAFLRACSRKRLRVFAWTVNQPGRMRQLAALGVAGILSDHPALLVRTLGAARAGTKLKTRAPR